MPSVESTSAAESTHETAVDAARTSAALRSCDGWGTLVVSGTERATWLEGLVTCQVSKLQPGQGTWGLALNRQGKIQSELWIVATIDQLLLALAPDTIDSIEPELGRMLIMEDAELRRPAVARHWFTLHGPQAATRAQQLAEQLGGAAAAIDWSGLGGAALSVELERAQDVRQACAGQVLSEAEWLRLRVERNLPELGRDFDGKDRPHEAALERRAVNWSKGCYLGQEVVCMQDMRGKVKRSTRLLRVEAPEQTALPAGSEVLDASQQSLGSVTSSSYSPRARSWLALARLDLEALAKHEASQGAGAALSCGPAGAAHFPAFLSEPI
jgi:tRNA-modifying protein YgfZ